MSLQNNMIPENVLEDGLNANADNNDININNDNDIANNIDRCEGDKNDKPDYLDVNSDRNINIRCITEDFEVIIYLHA